MAIPIGFGRRIFPGRKTGYPQFVTSGTDQRVVWNAASLVAGRNQSDEVHAAWRRLLYVTLTRARHSLVIPAMSYLDSTDSFAAVSGFDLADIAESIGPLTPISKTSRDTWAQLDLPIDAVDFKQAASRSLDLPDLIRPHALAQDNEVVESQFTEDAATYTYGRWWHLWIEKFPWRTSQKEQEIFIASIESNLPFSDRARRETLMFLKSSALAEILSAGKWFRPEVSFSYPMNNTRWIEGVIHLVIGTHSDEL